MRKPLIIRKPILGNPGVIHSVPTAFMNAVGTEWIMPGLPSMKKTCLWCL